MGFKSGTYIPTRGKCRYTKVAKYRSSYELAFIHLLEDAKAVKHWEFEHTWIYYKYNGKDHHYLVDFEVELVNNTKYFIEIKPACFINKAKRDKDMNWHKWNAAVSYARARNYEFKVIHEGAIAVLRRAWL